MKQWTNLKGDPYLQRFQILFKNFSVSKERAHRTHRQNGEEWQQVMKDMGNIYMDGLVLYQHGGTDDTSTTCELMV